MHKSNSYTLALAMLAVTICFPSCYRKATTFIYQSNPTNFVFPEDSLNIKPTAICFSGGGTRAMTCAAGQMKALDSLNLWDDVGYISSVSGGTWAASIFTYYKPTEDGPKNDKELLGTPLTPSKLTLDSLQLPISPKHMIYAVTRDFTTKLVGYILEDDFTAGLLECSDDIWIDAVGATYLAPYGLYGHGTRYFTHDTVSMKSIIKRNPDLKLTSKDFDLVHDQPGDVKRPYLVMNSSVLGPTSLIPFPKPEKLSVFNYSSLGVGATLQKEITIDKGMEGTHEFTIGGIYIEPFAMGGKAPISPIQKLGKNLYSANVKVRKKHKFRLTDAVGTSSAAFAADVAQSTLEEIITDFLAESDIIPDVPYWTLDKGPTKEHDFRFADGGSLDNFGVISMLQRKVEKMVVFMNTSTPIDTLNFIPGKDEPQDTTMSFDFYTLFDNYTYEAHDHNNVFTNENFVEVFNKFKACMRDSLPIMAHTKTKTIANPWWGTTPQDVEILWVYNSSSKQFEDQLSDPIRKEIAKGKDGMFPAFPYYGTIFPDEIPFLVMFSPAMTTLLYELQFDNVYSNGEMFNFLKD